MLVAAETRLTAGRDAWRSRSPMVLPWRTRSAGGGAGHRAGRRRPRRCRGPGATTTHHDQAGRRHDTTTTATTPAEGRRSHHDHAAAALGAASITDGQSVAALLAKRSPWMSVGVDTSGVRSAIAITQQRSTRKPSPSASCARRPPGPSSGPTSSSPGPERRRPAYASLDHAVKQAVLFLYVNGPSSLTVNPDAGNALAYAIDYADTAITPNGILATRGYDASNEAQALAEAKKAEAAADQATAAATAEVAAEKAEQARLLAELGSMSAGAARRRGRGRSRRPGLPGRRRAALGHLPAVHAEGRHPGAAVDHRRWRLKWAFAELGKPYVWGATGPNSFDCSGLTQFVWRQAGVNIPRVAAAQYAWTIPVPLSQLLPGDLVFYGTTDIHHVGIYIGDGLMINAPHTGTVVQVSPIWWSDLAGFGRVHATGTPVPVAPAAESDPSRRRRGHRHAGPVPSQTASLRPAGRRSRVRPPRSPSTRDRPPRRRRPPPCHRATTSPTSGPADHAGRPADDDPTSSSTTSPTTERAPPRRAPAPRPPPRCRAG